MCGLDPESKQEKPIPFCDNQDTISNTNGNEILETMTECHLIVANGRTTGDLDGNLTYHGVSGLSVIDLVITSPAMRENIRYFKVCKAVSFTDHCPIELCLKIGKINSATNNVAENVRQISKFLWEAGCNDKLCEALR